MSKLARGFWELEVYQAAFELQQRIFALSKAWPKEERYSLTDQLRRSSRAVGANLAEAWAKRRYPAHFLSKLTDSDGELQETMHWFRSAAACGYLAAADVEELQAALSSLANRLGAMIRDYQTFCL